MADRVSHRAYAFTQPHTHEERERETERETGRHNAVGTKTTEKRERTSTKEDKTPTEEQRAKGRLFVGKSGCASGSALSFLWLWHYGVAMRPCVGSVLR